MTHRTSVNRLLKLADHLEDGIAAADFFMPVWHMETECGAVACAFGHACSIPSFRKAGLRLLRLHEDSSHFVPAYMGLTGTEAAELFFGIDSESAHYLFDPLYYKRRPIRPRHVARRIRTFVKALERERRRELKLARNHKAKAIA